MDKIHRILSLFLQNRMKKYMIGMRQLPIEVQANAVLKSLAKS